MNEDLDSELSSLFAGEYFISMFAKCYSAGRDGIDPLEIDLTEDMTKIVSLIYSDAFKLFVANMRRIKEEQGAFLFMLNFDEIMDMFEGIDLSGV